PSRFIIPITSSAAYYIIHPSHRPPSSLSLFLFNHPPPPDIYTLSLHDALPICFGTRDVGADAIAEDDVGVTAGEKNALAVDANRSEEHTSELQSLRHLVCRLLLEKKKKYEVILRDLFEFVLRRARTSIERQ